MKDSVKLQFDLEQQIMTCWNVTDDIQLLYTWVMDSPEAEGLPNKIVDKLANALLGMETMYSMKFERLFDTFEKYLAAKRQLHVEPKRDEEDYFSSVYTD
jgi:hypothetical protein